jgi:hypothetical protein
VKRAGKQAGLLLGHVFESQPVSRTPRLAHVVLQQQQQQHHGREKYQQSGTGKAADTAAN